LAVTNEIRNAWFSPIVLGIISPKTIIKKVSIPVKVPNHWLPSTDVATPPKKILPPIFEILFNVTIVVIGRFIFSRIESNARADSFFVSASFLTLTKGTESKAASTPEHNPEQNRTSKTANISASIFYARPKML
jgi:hypothetical protein